MNMLLQPAPLPEEIDLGYLGRVMRINGFSNPNDTRDAMTVHFGEEARSRSDLTVHELLCRMASMSSEQYAQNHTALPLRRGITSYFPELRHGSPERKTVMRTTAMQSMLTVAFFCEECVKADIDFHGLSYWRRDHQTPGQLWCPKHRAPLHFTNATEAFIYSPAQFFGHCDAVPKKWVQEALSSPYVQRYLDMASALYEREFPLSVPLIAPVLRNTAKSQGFQAHAGSVTAALVSDRIRKVFPTRWLETVFHELTAQPSGRFMHQIDGALYMRTASSSVVAYLLVLAVLFEKPDDALNTLAAASSGLISFETRSKDTQRKIPDAEILLLHYAKAQGAHSEVVKTLGLPIYIVKRVYRELGLPNLPRVRDSAAPGVHAGLVSFYVKKRAFAESMSVSGICEQRFGALIRDCGPNMARALVMMDPQGKLRPRPAKNILAHEGPESLSNLAPA